MNIQILRTVTLALVIGSACNGGSFTPIMPTSSKQDALASVVSTVTIEGAAEAVFDLVTSARLWPQWHPATIGVSGVTERPYLLGDRIEEKGRIGAGEFRVTWKVAEHVRPQRVVLQAEASPVQIMYTFNSRGNATEFIRHLKYDADDLKSISPDSTEVSRLMRGQSEQAVKQLKGLVEKILREERIAAY